MFQAISYRKLGNKSDMYFLYSNFFDAFFLTNLMGVAALSIYHSLLYKNTIIVLNFLISYESL